jgi:hypothetical protein
MGNTPPDIATPMTGGGQNTPPSPEEIKKIVFEEDDFGHEMRVANVLENVEYPPLSYEQPFVNPSHHGGTYRDNVTGKTRQFDFRCEITRRSPQRIFLAVECKNLNYKLPLVVSGRPRTLAEAYHVFIKPGKGGTSQIRAVEGKYSLYRPDEFVGKSLLRLKMQNKNLVADNDSEIYDRWAQALASSHDLAFAAAYDTTIPEKDTFVMPLVVVPNNSLWIATYNHDGSFSGQPRQVDECQFYVDHKIGIGLPFVLTHIHFVTLGGLSLILSSFVETNGRRWETIFSTASKVYSRGESMLLRSQP